MNRRRLIKTIALGGAAAATAGLGVRSAFAGRYYDGPPSDHFDGRRFFNPGGESPSGLGGLLRWKLGGNAANWPKAWPSPHAGAVPPRNVPGDGLRVTMIGHASLLIQFGGLNILTDPVFSPRASPFSFAGPLRVNPPGVALADLPPIDIILLSHNHYDHLDIDTLDRLQKAHDPVVVTPLGNDAIVHAKVPSIRIVTQDWGDVFTLGALKIHAVPTHHWSARGIGDRRMALWSSFVVEGPGGRIYHVGDTGFHGGRNYAAAAASHGDFRLAILPIGAYEPRWFMKAQHQNPAEAVAGMQLLNAAHAVGHHWGTFQLTDEAIDQPRIDLHTALADARIDGQRFRPLVPGEAWDVPKSMSS